MYAMYTIIKVSRQVGSYTYSVNFTLSVVMFRLYSGFFRRLERSGSGWYFMLFLPKTIFNLQDTSEIQFPLITVLDT